MKPVRQRSHPSQRRSDGRALSRAVSRLSRDGLLREMEHAARILTAVGMTTLIARARTAALLRRARSRVRNKGDQSHVDT